MKMMIVLAVCLALSAASASASALQMPWSGMQGLYGAGGLMPMMGAEYMAQAKCSPVAAPYCGLGEQTMWQSRCQAMCGVAHSVAQQLQLQMMMQLQGIAAASSLYGPAALMQQWQQLLPAVQALSPLAMVMAQGGLYQQPGSYCTSTTTPCAAAIPPCH